MSAITIHHDPGCGTSRNTRAIIRNSGEEPQVIEYLETPPSREKLVELIAGMGARVCNIQRRKIPRCGASSVAAAARRRQ